MSKTLLRPRWQCRVCGQFWTQPPRTHEDTPWIPPVDGCTPPVVEDAPDTDFESAAEASARLQAERDADPASEYEHRRRHSVLDEMATRLDPIRAEVFLGPRTVDFRPDILVDEGAPLPATCCPDGCGRVGVERHTVMLDAVTRGIELVELRCVRCETPLLRVLVYLKGGPWAWQGLSDQIMWHAMNVFESWVWGRPPIAGVPHA